MSLEYLKHFRLFEGYNINVNPEWQSLCCFSEQTFKNISREDCWVFC